MRRWLAVTLVVGMLIACGTANAYAEVEDSIGNNNIIIANDYISIIVNAGEEMLAGFRH